MDINDENVIWDMELDMYEDILISEMHIHTVVTIEKQFGSEDLFPYITIKRINEDKWEGNIIFDYSNLPMDELLFSEFEYVKKAYPIYSFLSSGSEKELGLIINEDMSIKQAAKYVLFYSDMFYDYLIQSRYSYLPRLCSTYIVLKLPIYQRALSRVKMELENFVTDNKENQSKIVDICGRVKTLESITEKIERKKINKFSAFEVFDDIAGVRCTCEYLDDVYDVLEYIKENPLLSIIEIDDKIENCTSEGYRGVHVIVSTQIYYKGDLYRDVKVEIQLRTSFQNAWSMKTHELTYKRSSEYEKEVCQEMKELSDILYEADKVSLKMKNKISDENIILRKKQMNSMTQEQVENACRLK